MSSILYVLCFAAIVFVVAGLIEYVYKIHIVKREYKVLYLTETPTITMYRLKEVESGEEHGPCYWLTYPNPMPYADGSILTMTVSEAESKTMFRV